MGEREIGPKSLVERSKGCEELSCCLAMCSRFDGSGFGVMQCDMRCPMPLNGTPCFPFYMPMESKGYNGRKRGEREAEEILQGRQAFLFLYAGLAYMAGGDRDSSMPGACPLTGPCPSIVSGSSRPTPPRRVVP